MILPISRAALVFGLFLMLSNTASADLAPDPVDPTGLGGAIVLGLAAVGGLGYFFYRRRK